MTYLGRTKAGSLLLIALMLPAGLRAQRGRTVPFRLAGHRILVTARVDDCPQSLRFLVDTGGTTMLAGRVVASAKLKKKGFFKVEIASLHLGEIEIKGVSAVVSPIFKLLNKVSSVQLDGMIGSDLFDRFQVGLDYRKRVLTLVEGGAPLGEKGYRLRFTKHPLNNAPMISCRIDRELEVKAMIDTGQPYCIALPRRYLDPLGVLSRGDHIKAKGCIVRWPGTRPGDQYLARLAKLEFGPLRVENAVALFAQLPPMLSVPLLGRDFLSRFRMTIDYPRSEILLVPYEDATFADNLLSTGLSLVKNKAGVLAVRGLWCGSPADQAGIEVGEEIASMRSGSETTSEMDACNKFLRDDRIETIEIRFKGREQPVTLTKAPLLPPRGDSGGDSPR